LETSMWHRSGDAAAQYRSRASSCHVRSVSGNRFILRVSRCWIWPRSAASMWWCRRWSPPGGSAFPMAAGHRCLSFSS